MSPARTNTTVLAILGALVEERAGLHYGVADAEILEAKAGARASEAGFESLLDYYYHLRYDDPDGREFDALVEALVVHESYLFREAAPLRRLVADELLPRVRAGIRPRVWSAGCAHGEEPFTLAMLLDEAGLLDKVDLVATDVSARALARAARGELGLRALREGPDVPDLGRWIEQVDGRPRVSARLRERVTFRQVNLLSEREIADLGRFDAILCRNVLIYFTDARVRQVVERLARQLEPGGTLWVGVSESLLRFGTSLTAEEHGGVFFYRRGP